MDVYSDSVPSHVSDHVMLYQNQLYVSDENYNEVNIMDSTRDSRRYALAKIVAREIMRSVTRHSHLRELSWYVEDQRERLRSELGRYMDWQIIFEEFRTYLGPSAHSTTAKFYLDQHNVTVMLQTDDEFLYNCSLHAYW